MTDAAVLEMVEEIKTNEVAAMTVGTMVDGVVGMGLLAIQREAGHLHRLQGMTVIVMGTAAQRDLETMITIPRGDLVQVEEDDKTVSIIL